MRHDDNIIRNTKQVGRSKMINTKEYNSNYKCECSNEIMQQSLGYVGLHLLKSVNNLFSPILGNNQSNYSPIGVKSRLVAIIAIVLIGTGQ